MSWLLRDEQASWNGNDWDIHFDCRDGLPKCNVRSKHDNFRDSGLSTTISPSERLVADGNQPLMLGDAYVRQRDVIAFFPESKPWTFGYQVDLRLVQLAEHIVCLEFWLSIQTLLLDSHPQVSVRIGESFDEAATGLWISRSKQASLSVHPLDCSDSTIECAEAQLNMKVFDRFMEKGVIRRMRFRLSVADRVQEASFWREQSDAFSDSPLPLTT